MILKDRLSQIIFERTDVFPHSRFIMYLMIIGGLLGSLFLSAVAFLLYWGMTLPDAPDLGSKSYVEFMKGERLDSANTGQNQ